MIAWLTTTRSGQFAAKRFFGWRKRRKKAQGANHRRDPKTIRHGGKENAVFAEPDAEG